VSTLRNISSCQEQFRAAARADLDGDAVGEFGGFLELSGKVPVRGSTECLCPPLLSGAFRTLTVGGEGSRSGYLFRIYLLGADGVPVGESPGTGFSAAALDADQCELRWVCYAWPRIDVAGTRTFAVDWNGNIVATSSGGYVGAVAPAADAAFGVGGMRNADRALFDGTAASDGNVWRLVN